jgi:copper(I)-binding protein
MQMMLTAAALAALACAASPAGACEGLQVSEAWIREAPPGAPAMAGYARLHNGGSQSLTLDGGSSPAFARVELHRSTTEGGMARMLPRQTLSLKPGEDAVLAPQGYHLMLWTPRAPLAAGDTAEISLRCGASATSVRFAVRRPSSP